MALAGRKDHPFLKLRDSFLGQETPDKTRDNPHTHNLAWELKSASTLRQDSQQQYFCQDCQQR
jgi:hypothetical protein